LLQDTGITPVFPLWARDTRRLSQAIVDDGFRATITCVDPKQLAPHFVGRLYDHQFLADLPPSVDPCGENGEFHSYFMDRKAEENDGNSNVILNLLLGKIAESERIYYGKVYDQGLNDAEHYKNKAQFLEGREPWWGLAVMPHRGNHFNDDNAQPQSHSLNFALLLPVRPNAVPLMRASLMRTMSFIP
jgi:hypothetical protein